MKDLDRTDLKILQTLQAEGRLSNQTLAARVSLSPSACLARVRQLETDGVIAGYHAHIVIEEVRPTVIILAEIVLQRHNPQEFARFEAAIKKIPEIVEAAQVSGQFDYLLKVVVPDIKAWRDVAGRLQDSDAGVEKVFTHIVLKEAKAFSGFPLK
jgi:DNA-binding Lrp family transcriptional regulator